MSADTNTVKTQDLLRSWATSFDDTQTSDAAEVVLTKLIDELCESETRFIVDDAERLAQRESLKRSMDSHLEQILPVMENLVALHGTWARRGPPKAIVHCLTRAQRTVDGVDSHQELVSAFQDCGERYKHLLTSTGSSDDLDQATRQYGEALLRLAGTSSKMNTVTHPQETAALEEECQHYRQSLQRNDYPLSIPQLRTVMSSLGTVATECLEDCRTATVDKHFGSRLPDAHDNTDDEQNLADAFDTYYSPRELLGRVRESHVDSLICFQKMMEAMRDSEQYRRIRRVAIAASDNLEELGYPPSLA